MTERRLLISDFGGHPFTYELADALVRRGLDVEYSYCATNLSPKGRFNGEVHSHAVGSGWCFEKYRPLRRLVSELRYGFELTRLVRRLRPTDHVVCNMPLISGTVCWLLTLDHRLRFIVWFQDVQSGLASASAGIVGRALSIVESFLLQRADRIIAISQELADEAVRRGVDSDRVRVLENWAPVERFEEPEPRTDELDPGMPTNRPLFLYSGTLARKHDPSLIFDLAVEVSKLGGQVVLMSEGEGADWLCSEMESAEVPPNLTILPYQPFPRFALLLRTADVLVAILDDSASIFSVPSKTLSYLCAGRAVLASIPDDNPAARLLSDRAEAGLVSSADDRQGFLANARRLALNENLRDRLGRQGRTYSEIHFAEPIVVQNFLAVL